MGLQLAQAQQSVLVKRRVLVASLAEGRGKEGLSLT